jgi:MATE family multidrug resistance protein
MVLMIVANILNFLLDWVLVLGVFGWPGLGVIGAAWATWMSRLVLMIGSWALVRQSLQSRNESLSFHKIRLDKKVQWDLARLGLPSAGHMLLEVGAFGGSTLIAARFGSVAIAAHQITLQIASLTFMVPLGISQAGAVWVGNSIGAKVWSRARAFAFRTVNTAAVFMSISGVTMWFFGEYWLRLFTNSQPVIQMGLPLLRLAALFQLWDGIQISTSGVLRGMQDTRSSMIANAIGHWVIGLPLGAYLAFYKGYEVRGLWMGLSFGLFLVAVGLYIRLRLKFL